MKSKTILGALFVLALILTACAPAPAAAPTATTEPVIEPTEAPAVTGEATVQVSEVESFGPILVDGEGLSLYLFTNDTQNGGASTCTGDCAVEWPPLLSQGAPIAGDGLEDPTLLGTITRDDGSFQVTFNGWPLYYFDEDTAPGDTNGQGMEGLWFLVAPTGEPIPQ